MQPDTFSRIEHAADVLFTHGILDDIADDAAEGRLDQRDAFDDATTIARIVLEADRAAT